ncbi:hypothetical protein SAMN05444920_106429 [Nonomuraea solani]|uniref:Uncharacterized protein n=1 Tax=Nonomuraea solani TaxID=1144553 RepID=A0A1H6DVE0_9ACTN|nr:hypothetical protein [Nonomuraea solani]SEG89317.1 hypothetical protein SAMN05444920_106429 [Nonomuraea solani]
MPEHQDLSNSPQAQPDAIHTGLGRELHVNNPRFLNPYLNLAPYTSPMSTDTGIVHVDGWAIRFGNVEIISANYAKTRNLSQALNLNGTVQGGIEQELLTTPGKRVTVKMRAGHNQYTPNQDTKMHVQVNGDANTRVTYQLGILTKLVDQPTQSNYWHEVSYTFRAKGHDILQIDGDENGGVGGPFITEVRAYEADWDQGAGS